MASDEAKLHMEEEKRDSKGGNSCLWVALCCILVLVIVGLLIGIIILAVENTAMSEAQKNGKKSAVCTSPHCVVTAGHMIQKIDPEVDPCDNFYEYSCGRWLRSNIIPEDQSSLSTFITLNKQLEISLKTLFEGAIAPDDIESIVKVKRIYASCMDLDTINQRDAQPLLQFLHDHGGFPVLQDNFGGRWNSSEYDLESLLARLTATYSSSIIGTWVGIDDKNSSRRITHVDQPSLFMGSRDYYLDEKYSRHREAYLAYMISITTMLGANETTAKRDMRQVLELETIIANMSTPKKDRRDVDKLYNLMTLANLTQEVNVFNWTKYFDVLMPEETKPFLSTEEICNYSPKYIKEAMDMLVLQTSSRLVANYVMWRLASSRISYLSERFRDERQKIREVFYGIPAQPMRYRVCVSVTNGGLKFAAGRMYVAKHFSGDSKANMEEMIVHLRKAFKGMLEYNEWMDEETKIVARGKIDAMRQQIGYPDWIFEDDTLNKYYEKFNPKDDSKYFEGVLSRAQWSAHRYLTRLRKPVDKDEWTAGPAVVNAFYSRAKNRMVFPAGILQPPFYHKDSPWYLNYGGIGSIIGHEITHGFDDRGRKFDKDGNLQMWWTNHSSVYFNERAQCIVDQYDQYVMPEINKTLNGFQTQGENIADNGGLKEAHKAYADSAVIDESLPGFEHFTPEQMYFLNNAQVSCRLYRPEKVENVIITGVHSPGRYRVIGPMQNSKPFAKAFSCRESSYMNPPNKDKCVVW